MVRWGDEKTLEFAIFYRSYECLWNTKSPLYKNKESRINAYNALIRDMKDNSLTVIDMKNKIKNLRTTFHQEKRKIQESVESGVAKYDCKLRWFKEMHACMCDGENEFVDINCDVQISEGVDILKQESDVGTHSKSKETKGQLNTKVARKFKLNSIRNKRNSRNTHLESNVTRPKKYVAIAHDEEDEFYYYALNVASQLRTMPLKNALKAQCQIQRILADIRIQPEFKSLDADSTDNAFKKDLF